MKKTKRIALRLTSKLTDEGVIREVDQQKTEPQTPETISGSRVLTSEMDMVLDIVGPPS